MKTKLSDLGERTTREEVTLSSCGVKEIIININTKLYPTFTSEAPGDVVESRGQTSILSSLQEVPCGSLALDTCDDSAQLMLSDISSLVPSAPVVELGSASRLVEDGVGIRGVAIGGGVMNTVLATG